MFSHALAPLVLRLIENTQTPEEMERRIPRPLKRKYSRICLKNYNKIVLNNNEPL